MSISLMNRIAFQVGRAAASLPFSEGGKTMTHDEAVTALFPIVGGSIAGTPTATRQEAEYLRDALQATPMDAGARHYVDRVISSGLDSFD